MAFIGVRVTQGAGSIVVDGRGRTECQAGSRDVHQRGRSNDTRAANDVGISSQGLSISGCARLSGGRQSRGDRDGNQTLNAP